MANLRRIIGLARRTLDIATITALAKIPVRPGARHRLAAPVVVSLTSFPPRFETLHLTLRTLLRQSLRPDRLVLWIAEADRAALPSKVMRLQRHGLEIRTCEDLRSFKKIIPALEAFPDAHIVTADDDIYYGRNWLEGLLSEVRPGTREIVCYRALRFVTEGARMLPIARWAHNVRDAPSHLPSRDLFPTSGAGAVYPPGTLHPDVTRREAFLELTPMCDDTWLAWMTYRAGTEVRVTERQHRLRVWKGTLAGSLYADNIAGRMDRYIAAMSARYGPLHRLKDVQAPVLPPA